MRSRNIVLVVLWTAGSLTSFIVTALAVRVLAARLSVFEILACRNLGGLVLLGAAAAVHPRWRSEFRLRRPALQFGRNIAHFTGQYTWAYCVTVLPLATVFALEFTAPVWLAGLAAAFLGERLTAGRLTAIGLGLVGVVIILRPGPEGFEPASLIMLFTALTFAITAVTTKALTRTETTFSILFWMNAIQLVPNLIGSDPLFLGRIGATGAGTAVALAISGLTSHLCLTQAYRYGDAVVVMPLDFVRIPLIAVVGWKFYGEPLDPYVFLGAAIIVAGIVWNLRQESRAGPDPVSASRTPGSGPAS